MENTKPQKHRKLCMNCFSLVTISTPVGSDIVTVDVIRICPVCECKTLTRNI